MENTRRLNTDFARAEADASVGCVDDTELSGSNALDWVLAVDMESTVGRAGENAGAPTIGVTNFERHIKSAFLWPRVARDEVEIGQIKGAAVLKEIVVAMGNVENVLFQILFHHEPRTTTQPESLALSDGMKPVSVVLAHFLARFDFDDRSFSFAQEATYEVVVIDFSQEADALRILTASRGKAMVEGDLAHLFFFQMA